MKRTVLVLAVCLTLLLTPGAGFGSAGYESESLACDGDGARSPAHHQYQYLPQTASKPPNQCRRGSDFSLEMNADMRERGNAGEALNVIEGVKFIALTFDDGPHAVVTPRILDALKKHNAGATFFVLGSRVRAHETIVRRMLDEGHTLGNHSYDHRQLDAISVGSMQWQIEETSRIIEEITGSKLRIMRPPYRAYNAAVSEFVASLGMSIITWDIDPRDWVVNADAQVVAEHIIERAQNGSIILLHDMYVSTAEATEIVLEELTARGFVFVTVEELFAMNGGLVPGVTYRSAR